MPEWFVDDRCTNCDVARQLAPGLIEQVGNRSKVIRQPRNNTEEAALVSAAFACPTKSIRLTDGRVPPALDPYPMALTPDVYFCGHNSYDTAGANSYLVIRPGGNLMIDTPRFSEPLAARYERLGRITDVLLTHRDHAAHGRQYADRFGAKLWIHQGDLAAAPDADRVVTQRTDVVDGVTVYPFPGHTEGSVLFLVDDKYCFSGDSMYWSRRTGDIEVAETVTWFSIKVLARTFAESVADLRFEWLLPGHGDRIRLPADEMSQRLQGLADRLQAYEEQEIDFTAVRW
ncbi:MBL fold metallo-hydrolase [Kibdelosporangium lantanae]|uniref:MBL fold metallo-hydrolase n=1 Tax=Kibdelosporangium lantanae TaxID=1497396 RepID=A0ABW3MD85_9PSEU